MRRMSELLTESLAMESVLDEASESSNRRTGANGGDRERTGGAW
jgi:hypothetical protein